MREESGKAIILLVVFILIIISTLNCLLVNTVSNESTKSEMTDPKAVEEPRQTQETPVNQFTSDKIFQDTFQNKINYNIPSLYLAPGTQSNLSDKHFNAISKQLLIENDGINRVGAIFRWKQNYFKTSAVGGKFIGKTTINQIMEEKTLTGCHDHGLVLVSVLRKYGFPAIMVDTAGIQWALNYAKGKQSGFIGHVFVEAYVNERWMLINSTSGEYIDNYEPCNPVIPMPDSFESKGYFALFKGLDPAGYGITSNEQLKENLKMFASKVKSTEISLPPYKIKILP